MKNVVIGFLGTQLDSGAGAGRWEKWRPSVALAQQKGMPLARLHLLHVKHDALIAQVTSDIAEVSPETQVHAHRIDVNDPWDFGEVYAALYDFFRDFRFDLAREDYFAHITTGTHVAQICMFLMVESRFLPGKLLQTAPPRRQRAGDPGGIEVIDLDLARYDAIAQRFASAEADAISLLKSGIATRNAAYNALINEVERVAVRSSAPMLLMGPTGAGKSFLAARVFELKRQRHQLKGAFVDVNCATLTGDGAASALFGHVRGAFTGAASDRAGLLRTAHQGLLFLDEIGELGLDEQAMLLRAIEEKRFLPVGSDKEAASDFQLIAGTNRDLRVAVREGRFREDLFARINTWLYVLPGLAERREDIEPNIDYLLEKISREVGVKLRFNAEARAAYLTFAIGPLATWAGNFRDLTASLTRMATLAVGGRIALSDVEREIERLNALWQPVRVADDFDDTRPNAPRASLQRFIPAAQIDAIDPFDQVQLAYVLNVCSECPTLTEAGRRLFAASRKARQSVNDADRLRKYLARFGLTFGQLGA
jgi:transcriptional regulatory protein RtcR